MSNRSEYHKQNRLKNKDKLNDYHKKYYHIKRNNDIDDKPSEGQNEKIEINTEPIKKYNFTEKREAAFKKMVAARKKQLEELKEIIKMPDSDNSSYLTDSENSENEKNEKIEHAEPSEHMEHVEDVTHDKDISITIKTLMEELHETREENENLKSILENFIEIVNDQIITLHKQLEEMKIENEIINYQNN